MKYLQNSLTSGINRIIVLLALLMAATACLADTYSTSVYQPYAQPPLTWNDVIWQPGPSAPCTGNAYEVLDGGLIRNPPVAGVQTFAGDSLTLGLGAVLKAKGPSGTTLSFPGVDGNPGLILRGGKVRAADNHTFTIAGRILVVDNSFLDHVFSSRSFTITARIEGEGSLTLVNGDSVRPLDVRSEHNLYSGNWLIERGCLKGTGDGSLGTGNITVFNGAMLELNYDIRSPGELTLVGNDSVMILHQDCQFGMVTINNVALAPGSYDYAQLISEFPGNFAAGGFGSITVAPLIPATADSVATDQDALPASPPDEKGSTETAPASDEKAEEIVDPPAPVVDAGASERGLHLVPIGIIDLTSPLMASAVIVSADSTSQITIRWTASSDSGGSGIAGYKIFREGILVGTTTSTTYTDSGLSSGVQYCYTVVAIDAAGNAASHSAQSCATPPIPDVTPPSTPTGVLASARSATEIAVQWNASMDVGVGVYRIFRNGMLIASAIGTTFSDIGLEPNTQYCYNVDAFDYRGKRSSLSVEGCATTFGGLAAPSDLRVGSVKEATIVLIWKDNSDDESGFVVERAPSADGPWIVDGTRGANVTYFISTGLTPSTTYYYRVSAYN